MTTTIRSLAIYEINPIYFCSESVTNIIRNSMFDLDIYFIYINNA